MKNDGLILEVARILAALEKIEELEIDQDFPSCSAHRMQEIATEALKWWRKDG